MFDAGLDPSRKGRMHVCWDEGSDPVATMRAVPDRGGLLEDW
jgi:hypothetical protein